MDALDKRRQALEAVRRAGAQIGRDELARLGERARPGRPRGLEHRAAERFGVVGGDRDGIFGAHGAQESDER